MQVMEGRCAVVIGGGGGIGRGISLGLTDAGMRVVVADIDPAAAEVVAQELRARGGDAISTVVDATDRSSLERLRETALETYDSVDLFSNNVGVIANRRLSDATEADWAWFVEFNIMSIVRGVDVFLPALRAQPDSHLVNTASMAGLVALAPQQTGGFHTGLYVTTKHALIGYSKMLRAELEAEGIGVSVLCPGLVHGNLSVTAARNRPERFGGPDVTVTEQRHNPYAMPNEDIGPTIVAGIRANRLFLFTHTDEIVSAMLAQEHAKVTDDFHSASARAPDLTASGTGDRGDDET